MTSDSAYNALDISKSTLSYGNSSGFG